MNENNGSSSTTTTPALAAQALDECRRGLLDTLGGLLRDFKYIDISVVEATQQAAGEQFDILTGLRDKKSFEAQRSLTASRISLVHEEDLEFSIRLADLAQQLRERCELPLGNLHLRFMTLLDQQEAAPEQLPVGPETVGCALRALASEAGLNPDERIRMLQDVRSELGKRLKALYEHLNTRLAELGIEPRSMLRSSDRNLSQDAGRRSSPATSASPASTIDPMLANALRDRMLAWLEEQLKSGDRSQITHQLSSTELAALLPADTRAAVDLIERALKRIADSKLPEAAKLALDALRIPLLKAALRDASLATDTQHPARQLLSLLTQEGNELPADASVNNAVVARILQIAAQLASDFKEDLAVFEAVLSKVKLAREGRLAALHARGQAVTDCLAREERNELARRNASNAIRALCSPEPPVTVRIFLEHYWSVVLRRALLSFGEKSEEWRQSLKVADTLIWSMLPKTDANERERLVRALPQLLQNLQAGLDSLHVSPQARDRLLARFTALHTEALHGRDPKLMEPGVTPPPEDGSRLDPATGQADLPMLRRPGFLPPEIATPAHLNDLGLGQPLRFLLPDGNLYCGVIIAFSPHRQVLLLSNSATTPEQNPPLLAVAWTELMRQHQSGSFSAPRPPELF